MMWRIIRLDRSELVRRLGRRGACLLLLAIVYIVSGLSIIIAPGMDRFSRPGPGGTLQFMDGGWLGYMWLVCGTVAAAIGAAHDRRRVAQHDALGFNALIIPAAMHAFFFAWSAVMFLVSGGVEGNSRAVTGLTTNVVVVVLILLVAGWPEPPEPPEKRERRWKRPTR